MKKKFNIFCQQEKITNIEQHSLSWKMFRAYTMATCIVAGPIVGPARCPSLVAGRLLQVWPPVQQA